MKRLNVELEFVQSLRVARDKIDEIEKKLSNMEGWQATTNTSIAETVLKAETLTDQMTSLEGRMTPIESGAWQSTQSGGKGEYSKICR